MSEDTKAVLFWLTYLSIACVAFGFVATKALAAGVGAVVIGFIVAAAWPVSGLIWLGAWLA
ncbi:hypothetical protein [Agrobacterium pusense]|uniref:Uncharacterized protein n=1 Tax=Agrobacterium pusense TaxID=648995 RepID=A0A6H0ZL21_9HYPH|nr:hypothetical protein [Agrobacterium pusense]QIX20747.1 hypothetical protein FOB41_06165 [Agrobacterium pusense]WCK22709.1 hypothetical protein CFBP5496_0008045 [Agrobacterium pusense]